jgi:hypothetical protein
MIANIDKKTPFADYELSPAQQLAACKSKNIRRKALGLFLLFVGLLGAWSQMFSSQFNAQLKAINMQVSDLLGSEYQGAAMCSGNGISIMNGKCLCDLGHSGPVCDEDVLSGKRFFSSNSHSDLTEPVANTVLLVTDHFGASLNPEKQFEAESTQALAIQLNAAGYKVSVLYTGEIADVSSSGSQAFQNVARDMNAQGIQLTRYVNKHS